MRCEHAIYRVGCIAFPVNSLGNGTVEYAGLIFTDARATFQRSSCPPYAEHHTNSSIAVPLDAKITSQDISTDDYIVTPRPH